MALKGNSGPVRWGIIGCGDVTEVKSGPAYQKTEGFELRAVMRRSADKVRDYAERHDVKKYYTDADQLINDEEVDAVYIATPPDSHKYYGLKVAEAGKPCCIEKPLSPGYRDSLAICEAFSAKELPLFVAYYRRSLPRFVQVKKWLDDGEIGAVRTISWRLHQPASDLDLSGKENWRTDAKVAPGGYFDDLASHGIDLFTYLLGNIKEVSGVSLNQQALYSAKDAIAACWCHDSDITGTGSWNFGTSSTEERVEISGSAGKIGFSVFEEKPVILDNNKGRKEMVIKHPENVQLHHVQLMKEHLSGYSKHPSVGLTALHTSWVMDKILGKV